MISNTPEATGCFKAKAKPMIPRTAMKKPKLPATKRLSAPTVSQAASPRIEEHPAKNDPNNTTNEKIRPSTKAAIITSLPPYH